MYKNCFLPFVVVLVKQVPQVKAQNLATKLPGAQLLLNDGHNVYLSLHEPEKCGQMILYANTC